jgi:hypothetical protein
MIVVRAATLRLMSANVVAALVALAAGALVVQNATLALVLTGAVCTLCISTVFAPQLPGWFLKMLWALLILYALFGRGAAYLNVGGIFVGEFVLAFGVIALLVAGGAGAVPFRSRLVWGIIAFGLWGAARTFPYVGRYGIDALRDAVTWGYAVFALLVAGTLRRTGWTSRVVERYGAWLLWYPVWVPIAWALTQYGGNRLPFTPGTDIPFVSFKAGDATQHLVGVAAFVVLGLHRPEGRRRSLFAPGGWVWWSAWLAGAGIVSAVSRASMLAILLSGGVVLALRPATRVWRPVMAAVVIAAIVFASGIRIEVRDGRYLSAQDLAANALSISGRQVRGDRNGTREWRLEWWRTIVGYTVEGPYFWTGKGFGVNLAQDDGFVVGDADDHPLRSPHNGHLTILARAGVPGALLWLVLQCGFALALLRAYRRSANTRADWWARVDLWILASWVTFVVDAAFDVVLEGPQAGIWFWSIFGFGIAVLEVQRRSASEVPVGPALPEAGRLVPPPRQHASV